MNDPLDLREQEAQQAERQERDKLARGTEESDIKWMMATKRGRRIIWRLLEQAGVYRLSFSTNALSMAFAEGNRSFGNRTLALLHATCPELYAPMVKENSGN